MTVTRPAAAPSASSRFVFPLETDMDRARWADAFRTVRDETENRAAPLSPEDQVVQSMPDASPVKWHRAHTTWFFEQFLLGPMDPSYKSYDEAFAYLYNSYYVAAGPRYSRPKRGLVTRPSVAEVASYRAHVDAAVLRLIETCDGDTFARLRPILLIGLNHEQQHQELMLTDILSVFAHNPLGPIYNANWRMPDAGGKGSVSMGSISVPGGIYRIGHEGEGFSFDNEGPSHQVLIQDVEIGPLVTNRDWLAFIADGGYRTQTLWLSDGWAAREANNWDAPDYWREVDGRWATLTPAGLGLVDPDAPVSHVSYYEADAFARWAGKDLPTEQEWEVAAAMGLPGAHRRVWQWTRSAYSAYPGYRAAEGALGEYNGKFMINQMVLRGSSVATPEGHARASYRNFWPPHTRFQFTGLRLSTYAGKEARR